MRGTPRLLLASLCLATATATAPAWALPTSTLNWVAQFGEASGSEPVEVWVTLSLPADASGPLVLDGSTTSFSPEDLEGFETITSVERSAYAACAGSFWPLNGCFDPTSAWRFVFAFGPESYLGSDNFTLQPGESRSFQHSSFTPQNGPVAPGTYTLGDVGFTLEVVGLDAAGAPLSRSFTIGQACSFGDESCYFTRVVPVPEPAAVGLMALGLGVVGWRVRRRLEPAA